MPEDLYSVLGVAPGATQEQIETAYRRLARQYHPDINPAPEAVARMQAINNAFAVLRDPERRVQYDRSRQPAARLAAPMTATSASGGYAGPRQPRPAVEHRSGTPDEMPKVLAAIIGAGLLIFLLTVAWIISSSRRVTEARAIQSAASAAAVGAATPATRPPTATPSSVPPAIIATARPTTTPTSGRAAIVVAPSPTAPRSATPSPTLETPTVPTETPQPTDTPTRAPTVAPTATATQRPTGPPLALAISDLYNEQETRAGGRRFQIKLTIRNQGTQTLNPPWRPRFLIYAGQRMKGWLDAGYYGADQGGVDIAQQPAVKPGQEITWAWYTITAGPDEWVRQVEFDAQGWRWLWTFDNNFQNPQLSITPQ